MSVSVFYSREATLDVAEFRLVLIESGLGRVRPVDDATRLRALISGATNLRLLRFPANGSAELWLFTPGMRDVRFVRAEVRQTR